MDPRNWHFKQEPVIFLSHLGFCLKGSHNIDKHGEDPGRMRWVCWMKKYIGVKNICVTCESGANALWDIVQRLENLAFLCQGCCWLPSRTVSPSLLSYAIFSICVAFLSLAVKQFNGRCWYLLCVQQPIRGKGDQWMRNNDGLELTKNLHDLIWSSLVAQMVKRPGFDPRVGKIPRRRDWQPTPVFLPEEFHGQRSLASYGPWGQEELDTTEH